MLPAWSDEPEVGEVPVSKEGLGGRGGAERGDVSEDSDDDGDRGSSIAELRGRLLRPRGRSTCGRRIVAGLRAAWPAFAPRRPRRVAPSAGIYG